MEADLKALIAKLDALNGKKLKNIQAKALRQVGVIVKDAIIARTPVRVDAPSGNALPVGALKADIKALVHIAKDENAGDPSTVTIGPSKKTAYVARWIEYGHEIPRAHKPNARKNVPPRPFIRPAFDSVKSQAIETYETIMREEIAKAMK